MAEWTEKDYEMFKNEVDRLSEKMDIEINETITRIAHQRAKAAKLDQEQHLEKVARLEKLMKEKYKTAEEMAFIRGWDLKKEQLDLEERQKNRENVRPSELYRVHETIKPVLDKLNEYREKIAEYASQLADKIRKQEADKYLADNRERFSFAERFEKLKEEVMMRVQQAFS